MKSILLLSFNDLPYRLKQCFLYCCLFPEDHVIINHRLIRLWIAEGFVEHVKGVTPEEVAKSYIMELSLFNLKYLNLSGTPIKELPDSIGQLRNLQTLNIMEANIEALPRGISKLLNLRHLIVGGSISRKAIGVRIPSSISKMKKLQSLAYIESEGNIIRLIANMKEREEEDLCASIQEMKVLSRLLLFVADGEEFLRVEALPSPPPYLDRLYLSGKLEKVPHWFYSLHCLTNLFLGDSRLEENLLPHIEALRSLRLLCLDNSYVRKELCFSRGFVNLRYLEVLNFSFLNKITIEKGVMSVRIG
ncbi:unnamed protein product [Prunus brigantina]